jgi:D-alanyl-D-alanine carboxypeptidase
MVQEIERLAIRFGMTSLRVEAAMPAIGFYESCRYLARPGAILDKDPRTGLDCLSMTRSFPRRQTRYGARIARLLDKIGIPSDYGRQHRLMLQHESQELATIGTDEHGREQMLHPHAAMAWYRLRNAAESDGVTLQVASAFRSVGHQVTIIERKRQANQSIEEILKVSAAPGYSEHHTGFAIDISCPDSTPLEECFESTAAFEWLAENAGEIGFNLSYPRNNFHGITYEPWHWKYHR